MISKALGDMCLRKAWQVKIKSLCEPGNERKETFVLQAIGYKDGIDGWNGLVSNKMGN